MSIIILSSRSEAMKLASKKGGFREFRVTVNILRDKGLRSDWVVLSRGKRSTFVEILFGKLLWDNLSFVEKEIFFSTSECTKDTTIFLSLKALELGVSRKVLRGRLEFLSNLKMIKFINREQYKSKTSMVSFFLFKEDVKLKKTPKYSGWTRGHRDHGTLPILRADFLPTDLDDEFNLFDKEILVWEFLSVGKFLLLGREYTSPDDDPKKDRNIEKPLNLKL
jgi:hypothetical protein